MSDAPKAPAGWYPSPTVAGVEQWWDGEQWTQQARIPGVEAPTSGVASAAISALGAVPQRAPEDRGSVGSERGLLVGGAVLSIAMPLIGFVLGIILASKPNHGTDGAIVMVVSVIAFVVWAQVLA